MLSRAFRTLKYRNYRLYFIGQTASLVGTQIQFVAVSWLAYRLTGSAAMLGLVGFVSRVPTFFVAPIAGVLADRVNRHKALMWIQGLEMLQAVSLAVLSITHQVGVMSLIILGFLLGVLNGFEVPVRQAFISEVVENKAELGSALSLNITLFQASLLVGPLLAGILLAVVGESWCFSLNAVSFISVLGCLMAVRFTKQEMRKTGVSHGQAFREGLAYTFGNPPLRTLLLLLAWVSLMGMSYQVLLPVFAKDILRGGPKVLGFLGSATGLGALLGTFYLASRQKTNGLRKRIAFAISLFGLGLMIFAFSNHLWISLIVLVPVGLGGSMQIASSQTLIQGITNDHFRGRVLSFYTMAVMGMAPFGGLLYGCFADKFGAPMTVFVGGSVCLMAGILFSLHTLGLWNRACRHLTLGEVDGAR
jgi:MFS family permease